MHNTNTAKNIYRFWIRLWPFYVIAIVLFVFWKMDLLAYLSFETLQEQQANLQTFVSHNRLVAVMVFIAIYTLAAFFMLPGGLWLTMTGGFMFGLLGGTIATISGATIGASLLFFVAKTSFGRLLHKIARPFADKVETEFRKDAISYMFAMRFMPALPFAVANILPVILGARYRDFLLTTVIGIIPGVVVYAWIGAGLGETFATDKNPDLKAMFQTMLPPAVALCLVSLLPIAYKKFKARKMS